MADVEIKIYGTLVRDDAGANRDKIVKGYQVEGGCFVCDELPSDGYWVTGQLCYNNKDNKLYQYCGEPEGWQPAEIEKANTLKIDDKFYSVSFKSGTLSFTLAD